MSAAQHTVRPGEFFKSSWGYDQTNVDFYKVVAVTPASVRIQPWSVKITDDRRVIPGDEPASARIFLKRVHSWSDRPALSLTSYANAYLWDGASRPVPEWAVWQSFPGLPAEGDSPEIPAEASVILARGFDTEEAANEAIDTRFGDLFDVGVAPVEVAR